MSRAAAGIGAAALAVVSVSCTPPSAPPAVTEPEDSPVVLLNVPADPTISFSLQFAVGSQNDPPGKEGLAYLTGEMLVDAATETRALDEILAALYPLAASYDIRVDLERSTLTGRVHRDNLDAYLELFTDAFLKPAFDEDDFERVRSDAINAIENTLRYSSDEELGKAALHEAVFRGTPYAHLSDGTVAGLRSITLDDVRAFYRQHYTRANALLGLGGGVRPSARRAAASRGRAAAARRAHGATVDRAAADRRALRRLHRQAERGRLDQLRLPARRAPRRARLLRALDRELVARRAPQPVEPSVQRHSRAARAQLRRLLVHRGVSGRRRARTCRPPTSRAACSCSRSGSARCRTRRRRSRCAPRLRELQLLVDNGLTPEQFELTRTFLKKYSLHFAETTAARLGYAVDDRFYGLDGEGHLARFRRMMDELTLEDVNAAIKRHWQYENLQIAIVTGEAASMRALLASGEPTPITYPTPKPAAILEEDRIIEAWPLNLAEERMTTIPVAEAFER